MIKFKDKDEAENNPPMNSRQRNSLARATKHRMDKNKAEVEDKDEAEETEHVADRAAASLFKTFMKRQEATQSTTIVKGNQIKG